MVWVLETSKDKAIRHPTWLQIQDAIRTLDRDDLHIKLEGTGSLIIGGGNGKRYIVIYIPEDDSSKEEHSMTLVDESLTDSDVILTVQTPAAYPARMAVQLPLVLSVAEQFYLTGKLPENVAWEP